MSEKQIFACAGKHFKDIYDLIKTMQETHKTFLTILQSHPMLKGILRKANNDVHSRINTQL